MKDASRIIPKLSTATRDRPDRLPKTFPLARHDCCMFIDERVVRRDGFARCAFSTAIDRAERLLSSAAENGAVEKLFVETETSVTVVDDLTDTIRRHEALEFHWRPKSRLLPEAQALLTVRPHAPQGTQLQLSITYLPPLGSVGNLFDAVLGRHIAGMTCALLLRHLRHGIEHAG